MNYDNSASTDAKPLVDVSSIFATEPPDGGEEGRMPETEPATFSADEAEEGGEGGKGPAPATPPSPPSRAPADPDGGRVKPDPFSDDVYRRAPSTNPVIAALTKAGLYRAKKGSRHEIACPWGGEHGSEGNDAIYAEPGDQSALGRFECPQCGQRGRSIGALLEHLEIDPAFARCKPVVRNHRGEIHRVATAAEHILSQQGDYYQTGGAIVRIKTDNQTGDVTTEAVSEQAATIALSKGADWEAFDNRSKAWGRVDVPFRVVTTLMRKGQYTYLRQLNGLARQPFFRRGDNTLVRTSGYDKASGMFAAFDGGAYELPEPTEENARTALAALDELIAEFHFASPSDKAAAKSAMLTAAIRSSLPLSPAFSISASRPGSGKSYLASLIACFGGPGNAHNTSYPTSAEEASKLSLSLMMTNPAVANFDDMISDWIPYAAINRMLTSETISDRVLGTNRVATARTATFIMGTGNNIRPLRDMARRVVSIYLNPRVEEITSLRYSGKPVEKAKAERARYVGYALTIISAYISAGRPVTELPNVPSYGEWSSLCRESLVWLGEPDPAASLIAQVNDDPDVQAFGDLLGQWYECFGEKPTMLRTLLEKADTDSDLKDALLELPVAERGVINRSRLGRFLSRNANRIVNGLELRQSPTTERNAWMIVAIDEAEKNRPPSTRQLHSEPARTWMKDDSLQNGGAAPGEIF